MLMQMLTVEFILRAFPVVEEMRNVRGFLVLHEKLGPGAFSSVLEM